MEKEHEKKKGKKIPENIEVWGSHLDPLESESLMEGFQESATLGTDTYYNGGA